MSSPQGYVGGQFYAYKTATDRLSSLKQQCPAQGGSREYAERLADAEHVVEFTGKLLADCVRAHGHGSPPRLEIEGYNVWLSDDGRIVILESRYPERRPIRLDGAERPVRATSP